MRRIAVFAAVMLAVVLPTAARAQTPVEIGVDGGLSTTLDSPRLTSLSIPLQRIRIGFFTSPRVSIEPYGALNYGSLEGISFTDFNFGTGLLYHFGAARSAPQPYVRPFLELEHNSSSSDRETRGTTAFALGGGIGVKVPIANRFAWRFEAALAHTFEADDIRASTSLSGIFGLSVFIH
jgi:hypothetical protein